MLCALVAGLALWSAPALAQRKHVFSAEFGSEGSGNGQLSRPGALAVNDATGDVYVVDRGNSRVEQFSATGAYIGQFNGSASPTGVFSWTRFPEGVIAVDNSTSPLDPSAGDVYVADVGHDVVDKFSASGTYIGQVTGISADSPFISETGSSNPGVADVAVDSNGRLWVEGVVSSSNGKVSLFEFNDASVNGYVSTLNLRISSLTSNHGNLDYVGLAIDPEGDIYIGAFAQTGGATVLSKFTNDGTLLVEELDGAYTRGVAVDRSSGDVYVDNETTVAAYAPSDSLIERFGFPQMHASEPMAGGVAVNSATGTVYTSDAVSQSVEEFTAFVVPDVTTEQASNFGETSATVNGVVNPDGVPVTSCVFEYGTTTAYGQTAPCSASPGPGNAPVNVSASVSGLERLTLYHFRLRATNANGSNEGADHTFVTPEPVAIGEGSVSDVSSDGAQFTAVLNPDGAEATFSFEYGTSTSYGRSVPVPAGDLGAGTTVEPVSVRAQGLLPQTVYHVRVTATNLFGTVYGSDGMFTTQTAGEGFALPDGRSWELVSPANKHGAQIEPPWLGLGKAAENGGAVAYLANAPIVAEPVGNPSPVIKTQVTSRRGPAGWSTEDVATPTSVATSTSAGDEYRYFTPDLSQALVEPPGETLLSPEATEPTPYVRDNGTGTYLPLVTAGNVPAGTRFGIGSGVSVLTGTPDLSHVLLGSRYALTSNATTRPEKDGGRNIYEWVAGRLTLVNVLPDGAATPGAVLGTSGVDIRGALSQDGSRAFWTESSSGRGFGPLYMRDIAAGRTVQVDAPAPGMPQTLHVEPKFETASVTGSRVFFVEGQPLTADSNLKPTESGEGPRDLYMYDTGAGSLTDLSVDRNGEEPSNVQDMVLGASEDGSIVYFVATGVLASGAEAGKDNLYVVSATGSQWSSPRLVAVLSPEDGNAWGAGRPEHPSSGSSPDEMASRVSPNGRYLAFMSAGSLTGYDNRDAKTGQRDEEVFAYDEVTERLRCVSCNPTGARPVGESEGSPLIVRQQLWRGSRLAAAIPAWTATGSAGELSYVLYQSRYLTNDGRLFFDSYDSLVGEDTNGTADVYEYEPEGVGNCGRSGGCVSLISSGTSGQESGLLDVSGKGPGGHEAEDVFFLTASRLVSQDYDSSLDVYDAHVCSTAVPCTNAPATPVECSSGDSCKSAPTPQPEIFGAPASATFSGAGNVLVAPPAPVVTSRPLTATQKRALALRACHRKRSRKAMAVCERQARKRYPVKQSRRATATGKDGR
ncbi:MAG TPA: hypothetical protein VNY27_06570 [Solirubrobacteraceae bacterium]|nr:hypothetical protein [Solirubrobacteraceae bacterium]